MPPPIHGAFEDRSEKNMSPHVKNGPSVGKKKRGGQMGQIQEVGETMDPGVLQC